MILTNYSNWHLILFAGFFLVWLFIEVFKWTSKGRILRSFSFIILLVSLMGSLWMPQIRNKQEEISILVGENASRETLDSLKSLGLREVAKSQIKDYAELITIGDISPLILANYFGKITQIEQKQYEGFLIKDLPVFYENEPSTVKINWQGRDNVLVYIIFQGDTLLMSQVGNTMEFISTLHPKWPGHTTVDFLAIQEDDTLAFDNSPVFIYPHKPWKIKFVTDQPNAELRTLINWLADQQHYIEIDYHLRKDFVKKITYNQNNLGKSGFTHIIWDGWPLTRSEEITGINYIQLSWPMNTQPYSTGGISEDSLTWQGPRTDEKWHTVENLGITWKIPTYTDTFKWKQKGDSIKYALYWSSIFRETKPLLPNSLDVIIPPIHWADEPLTIQFFGNAVPNDVFIDSVSWPFRQLFLPTWGQEVIYWPSQGWHKLLVGDTIIWFFTQKKDKWPAYRQQLWKQFLDARSVVTFSNQREKDKYVPISLFVWLGLFILATTLIWVEQRWNG